MTLALHAITGAVLASSGNNLVEAAVLGLVSHYFLDTTPHIEYKIANIKAKNIYLVVKDYVKILLDLTLGAAVILYFLQNKSFDRIMFALVGGFFALIPDGLALLDIYVKDKNKNIFTKFLDKHTKMHYKIHSSAENKIIKLFFQIIVIFMIIYMIYAAY